MVKVKGRLPPPKWKDNQKRVIKSAANRNGFFHNDDLAKILGCSTSTISYKFSNSSWEWRDLLILDRALNFTDDDWRSLRCR